MSRYVENRRRNVEEIRRAEQEERRRAREAAKTGEAFSNPFARVKTKAKFRHPAIGVNSPDENKSNGEPLKDSTPNSQTDTTSSGVGVMGTQTLSKNARRNLGIDDVIANLDLDIEL